MKGYKKRFIKEHNELRDRANKLERMLNKYYADKLDFEFDTPVYLLQNQLETMRKYLSDLRIRAEYEGIELEY